MQCCPLTYTQLYDDLADRLVGLKKLPLQPDQQLFSSWQILLTRASDSCLMPDYVRVINFRIIIIII